ncbi:large conductance mechanosensitive channel protein MscL [Rhodococcus rhodnii]|uniref:Large-conductance mechanosensitive channel n=2 Tax=Rhodococcus rhodnii TaxID=38312 RepID=R7WQM5_9NOCA|nr:large conductance mechanosensitive channel protein MscL [Rhodococcus rhodnii]EOM77627.1 large-conductance mechanosensitive channel [Rhodococcus rhodnii LMG 5362]TXG90206.1 large conductance mechanosensitive channel protein MscL [Rhodococcus rhodnii]
MLKGFKDFLLRGNVIDLAVAVVVGTAFTAIVTAFTTNIINPLIAVVGSSDMGFGFALSDNPETFVNLGAVVTAAINFVIIAAVVYFILILPANAAKKRFASEPADKQASTEELLIQIRDLLAKGERQVPQVEGADDGWAAGSHARTEQAKPQN